MNVIADSDKATKRLLTPLVSGGRIPFCFLTNGGMETEQQKCDKMNSLLKFTPEEP